MKNMSRQSLKDYTKKPGTPSSAVSRDGGKRAMMQKYSSIQKLGKGKLTDSMAKKG